MALFFVYILYYLQIYFFFVPLHKQTENSTLYEKSIIHTLSAGSCSSRLHQ